jgi:hypothetical protein
MPPEEVPPGPDGTTTICAASRIASTSAATGPACRIFSIIAFHPFLPEMSGLLHMYSERRAFMPIYFSVRQKFSGHTPAKN